MAKEKPAPSPPKTETEIEQEELSLASQSLEAQAKERFAPEFFIALKKIAYYTAKLGLPLNEACLLVDIDFKKFEEQMKLDPFIARVIRMKELEFKRDMLNTITQRARGGDDKLAMWLLEKKFPDEYGMKKPQTTPGMGDDVIFEAIRFIRKNGDSEPLVSEASGVNVRSPLPTPKQITKERIDEILNKPYPLLLSGQSDTQKT